eukprot:5981930-Prymnesium_polylepis.1
MARRAAARRAGQEGLRRATRGLHARRAREAVPRRDEHALGRALNQVGVGVCGRRAMRRRREHGARRGKGAAGGGGRIVAAARRGWLGAHRAQGG